MIVLLVLCPSFLCLHNHYVIGRDTSFLFNTYMFGLLATTEIFAFFKNATGRPRPHFLERNNIKFDANDHQLYYTQFNKSRVDRLTFTDSRSSFFSGHAAGSLYGATFVIMYLNSVNATKHLGVRVAQLVIFLTGCYPGITQYRNYWHHWTDVFAGYAVGLIMALLSFPNRHLA
ncbi:Phospholipid phosphatase 3 [Halotydeus destructor]|nr:Phospholipid phosphatase 3 [Halotydeus destructor]